MLGFMVSIFSCDDTITGEKEEHPPTVVPVTIKNTFSIYQVLPELIDLWGINTKTTVPARKN